MELVGAFKVDTKRVVHETIDGEAILIDLESGAYYSLTGPGAEIWNLIVAGWPVVDVIEDLAARYDGEESLISRTTRELIEELCRAGLLDASEMESPGTRADLPAGRANIGGEYVVPVLQSYRDMEYFLLLDPVHDVSETGWPNAKAPKEGQRLRGIRSTEPQP